MRIRALTEQQTTMYKGIGILLIALHNFLHTIPPVIGENEFLFQREPFENFRFVMLGPTGRTTHQFSTMLRTIVLGYHYLLDRGRCGAGRRLGHAAPSAASLRGWDHLAFATSR